MKLLVQDNTSSYITHIFVQDSSSVVASGLKGLQVGSAGLVVGYMRPGATKFTVATPVAVTTLGTFAGTATASAFTAVDATNAPGLYEFHFPNNALTNTANSCVMMLWGSNNLAPVVMEVQLTGFDPNASTVNAVTSNQTMSANVVLWGAASVTGVMTGALQVIVATNNDKTGYTVSTNNDKTGYSLSGSSIASANVVLWGAASPSGLLAGGVPIAANVKKNQALTAFEFLMTATPSNLPLTGVKAPATTRSIDGGSFAAGSLAGFAEIGNGMYSINFAAGDLNGNVITLRVATAGASDTLVSLITSP